MGEITKATNSPIPQNINLDQANATSNELDVPLNTAGPLQLRPQEDPVAEARTQKGLIQNVAEYKAQGDIRGQYMREELSKRMEAGPGKPTLLKDKITVQAPAPTVAPKDPTGLKPGEQISAIVREDKEGWHFEFQRPVTKEQAAAIVLQNGNLPKGATLVQGKGNTWTVKTPNDSVRQQVRNNFNGHEQKEVVPPKNPIDPSQTPAPGIIMTWEGAGGPYKPELEGGGIFPVRIKQRGNF